MFTSNITGHEHLDAFGLINMNGRAYDPVLARFLSPDPVVQNPYSSQSFNRYSYCWNNPLVYTDPTGYYTWMDINNIIDALLNDNTNFRYGGSWSADGSYEAFDSDADAMENTANILNNTDGGWESAIPPPGYQADLQLRITGWKPLFGTTSLNGKAAIFVPPVKIPKIESVTIWVPGNQQSLEANSTSPIPMPGNPAATRNPMPGGAASTGYAMETVYTIANTLNEFNPIAQIWDVVTYAFTGTDRFGHNISLGQGMLKAATMLPIGKIGSLVGKASGTELFNFSATAAGHMSNPSRTVPVQILEQALMSSKGVPDPRGSRALLYKTEMWKNGELHNLEILYDHATNSIWHFKYFKP